MTVKLSVDGLQLPAFLLHGSVTGGAVNERWATVGGEEEIRKDFLYFL